MACQIQELAEYILANHDEKSKLWKQVNEVINAKESADMRLRREIIEKLSGSPEYTEQILNVEMQTKVQDTKLAQTYVKAFKELNEKLIKATIKIDDNLLYEDAAKAISDRIPGRYSVTEHIIKIVPRNPIKAELRIAESRGYDLLELAELERIYGKDMEIIEFAQESEFNKKLRSEVVDKRVKSTIEYVKNLDRGHVEVHEIIHAAAYRFMDKKQTGKKEKAIQERIELLFDQAKKRAGYDREWGVGDPYWTKDVHEFIAEALSNPEVIRLLDSMQTFNKLEKLSNILRMLVDVLVSLVSTSKNKDSVYAYTMDGLMALIEVQQQEADIVQLSKIKREIVKRTVDTKSKTVRMAVDAREAQIDKVKDDSGWKRYAAETKYVPGKYNDYYGAMEKAITKIVDPKVVTNVVGLMLEDVFNGKFQIVAGDYDPDTHTVQIAEKPRQMEIEMAVEEGLQEEAIRLYEDKTENMAYRAKLIEDYVNKNRANALAYVISSVESVNGGHTTTHELIHAGSVNFMRDPKNANHPAVLRVKELYQEALARESDIKSMTRTGDVYTEYWKKNVEEFLSEALSNPQLMYALSNIKTIGKEKLSKGLFAELVESLIKMLGLNKKTEDNLLEFTMDGFAAIMEAQAVELSVPVNKELKEADKSEVAQDKRDTMTVKEILAKVDKMREECE